MARGTDVTNLKRMYREMVQDQSSSARLPLILEREHDLRYGENPNQPAAMYKLVGTDLANITNIRLAKSGKEGWSATNFMDVTRALEILKYFEVPAVAVMKHLNPSGFARQWNGNSLDSIYEQARDADARSAFGSIVVLNRAVDTVTAESITSSYVEVVAAPEFEEGVLDLFGRKKDLRAVLYSNLDKLPKFVDDSVDGLYDIKSLPTGRVLVQKPYLTSIRSGADLVLDPLVKHEGKEYVVERNPTASELDDLLTAWYVAIGVRSNAIVFVKNGVSVAIGTGQQERIGAIEQAIIKAYQKAMDREELQYDPIDGAMQRQFLRQNPLSGAVMSSDAFLPFRDSIDTIAKYGVTAIIQPGGSIRDHEVISAVNEHRLAMSYTLERCFAHF